MFWCSDVLMVERGGGWQLWVWPGDNCWAQHWGHGPALLPPPSPHRAPPASPLSSDKLGNSQMVGGLHLHTTLFIQHNQTNNSLFHLSDYILLPPSMLGTSWWIRRLRADLLPNLTNWRILFWHLREVFFIQNNDHSSNQDHMMTWNYNLSCTLTTWAGMWKIHTWKLSSQDMLMIW